MAGYKRIDPQIKEQILARIKNEGINGTKAAQDAGVSPKTVYGWLARKAGAGDPLWENNRSNRFRSRISRRTGLLRNS